MSYIGSKPADAVLETDDIADGVVTTSKLADDSVTNPKLFTGSQQNFRNIIINGDMSIAQRGTSVASITAEMAIILVDRYRLRNIVVPLELGHNHNQQMFQLVKVLQNL
jgi:hypothetical protein